MIMLCFKTVGRIVKPVCELAVFCPGC